MSFKIFKNSFFISLIVLLLSVSLFVGIVYVYYEDMVYRDMRINAGYIAHGMNRMGESFLESLPADERITWIAADGQVLYDSVVGIDALDNHLDREEVQMALTSGEGQSSHYSKTMLAKTMNHAIQLEDGTVLRISCSRSTVTAILLSGIQPLLFVAVIALALSFVLSSRLAGKIVKPINNIDLDRPGATETYTELEPLLDRLREQRRTIQEQILELGRRQREFSALTENMSEGFLLVDTKADVLSCNQSAMQLLDTHRPIRNIGQEECRPEIRNAVGAAFERRHWQETIRVGERAIQIMANPVMAGGVVSGAVVLLIDVTEQMERNTLRREFSANVSHELKTPLTSISGFAEIMKDGFVEPEKMREFSGDIYKESIRLQHLVDDIIRLSRIDEESDLPEKELVDLSELAKEVIENLRGVAEKKGVTFSFVGGTAEIMGVSQILWEMVYNLCENAVKYNTEGGKVSVYIKKEKEKIALSVTDTGIGIPYEHQNRIFERFYRVDKSHSKAVGGTGLGLSIVKNGARFHDAAINLKSAPGKGTTVTITFARGSEAL